MSGKRSIRDRKFHRNRFTILQLYLQILDYLHGTSNDHFQSPETGYTGCSIAPPKVANNSSCIVGNMAPPPARRNRALQRRMEAPSRSRRQFEVSRASHRNASRCRRHYQIPRLGLIKGIGPVTRNASSKNLASPTLDIIRPKPRKTTRYSRHRNDSSRHNQRMLGCTKTIRDVMVFLQQYGVAQPSPTKSLRSMATQL